MGEWISYSTVTNPSPSSTLPMETLYKPPYIRYVIFSLFLYSIRAYAIFRVFHTCIHICISFSLFSPPFFRVLKIRPTLTHILPSNVQKRAIDIAQRFTSLAEDDPIILKLKKDLDKVTGVVKAMHTWRASPEGQKWLEELQAASQKAQLPVTTESAAARGSSFKVKSAPKTRKTKKKRK